ncbi:uncharacterized protein BT62DRAFT_183523 [Guyanagaster necrorhizus]|uniref:Uncharacterized protein n=1 Tax=Guyanagaster necrorhizus TaxID=856835 RepID=A0A9P8ASU1_9AGAR|nr:uncharacterized protein BT62DRAFT_183523 [Guyanagaster necrorhizus MCA 3950]KAG7445207.1 hypothetical protein BT62DRAFT_183523 [Guyanagaster necrorhizus MCA 3950]
MANVLPVKILAQIIEEAWASPLTPFERLRMVTSSLLVSKSFAWEFTRVYCTDMHIFTRSHLNHVISRILYRDTVAFRSVDSSFSPSKSCRSISFILNIDFFYLHPIAHPAWGDIHEFMSVLQHLLPNVSRTSVNYHNWWYNDAQLAWLQLPEQITELDIVYTHSTVVTQEILEKAMLDVIPPRAFPGVKKLTIWGGNRDFNRHIALACFNASIHVNELGRDQRTILIQ